MSDDKPAPAPKKKGGLVKKLVMFGVLPLILVGGGVAGGLYAAGGKGGHAEEKEEAPPLVLREGKHGPTDLPHGVKINPALYKATYYQMEQPFTSNLRDTDGFLQLGLGVSTFYDHEVLDNLKDADMPVRSAVLEVLAESDAEVLDTPEGKTRLRKKLVDSINHVLEQRTGFGGVDDVYFTSFIIQ